MGRTLCLLYHRVNSIQDDIYDLVITPENFESHLVFLKDNFKILRFEDEWEKNEGDAVCITFDDGYADNLIYALPLLEKHKIPATIFVSSGYIGSAEEYWWDELSRLVMDAAKYPEYFRLEDPLYQYIWETDTLNKRLDMLKSMHWMLKLDRDMKKIDNWISQLRVWSGLGNGGRIENLPMNDQQLLFLGKSNYISIGAHTVHHRSLGARTYEEQEYEIRTSIKELEVRLNRKIDAFSYPFGSKVHYNNDTIKLCRENGIIKAATTNKDIWHNGDDLYTIPRVSIGNMNLKNFKECVECYFYE